MARIRNKLLESIVDEDDTFDFYDTEVPMYPDEYLSDEEMAEKGYEKIDDDDEDESQDIAGRAPWAYDKFWSPAGRKATRLTRHESSPSEADKTYADMENGDDGAFMGDDDIDSQSIEGNSYKDTLKWPNEYAANRSSYENSRRFRTPEDDEFEKDHVEEVDYDPDELFESILAKKKTLNEGIDDVYAAAQYRAKSVVKSFIKAYGPKMTRKAFEQVLPE